MKKLFIILNSDKPFLSHRKDIALGARQNGYDVTVVTHFTGSEEEIRDLGFRAIDLPGNPTGMNPFDELKSLIFLIRLFRKEKPDVIHNVTVKRVLWGTVAATMTGRKNVVNAIAGLGFLFSPNQKQSAVSRAICALLKIMNRSSYRYIFQNKDDQAVFEKAGISRPEQAVQIKGSGVNLQKYAYVSEESKDNTKIKIVFTGRMIEAKGILDLVDAAVRLRGEYKGKIQFLLCGDLDKNPTALSKERIEDFCDGDYIQWLGFQSDIYSVLKNCHIMAFPSFYMEGLPKSIIDAESAGLPVITTDWVGCRDTVEDGYNGFIIPPHDSEMLAEKIRLLVDDADLRRQMGKNARAYAEKYFSIENVVKRHLAIYDSFVCEGFKNQAFVLSPHSEEPKKAKIEGNKMTITVIGGSGFVGSRLVARILAAGHTVRIADKRRSAAYPELWTRCDIRNAPSETADFPESLTDAASAPGKHDEAVRAMPMCSLLSVIRGSDVVINLAAEHRDDVTPKSLYDEVNVQGSENVCRACTELGIQKIIFTSSVAVYGFAPAGTDESGEINYFNDYGRTKYLAEGKYREWLQSDSENQLVIIRPSVIFGEGNRGNVYNLLRQIAGGRFPMVGRGTNKKTMNYVENVAAFLQWCVENDIPETEIPKQVRNDSHAEIVSASSCGKFSLFNYCDEPAYDMNSLVLCVYKALGKPKARLFHFPYPLAYFGGLCFDVLAFLTRRKFAVSAIRVKKFTQDTYFVATNIKRTGFVPPVSLEEGLRKTIEYEFLNTERGGY